MKKAAQLSLSFYPEEKRMLRKLAKKVGCRTLSDLVRQTLIYRRIPVPQVDSQ
ncbi:hypothetical protein HYV43_01890 [Candidatus Micrarchaeota archaeon]|nr:hypothetical protein [Candidatus Micrarchaeota archaeon]